MTAQLSPVPVAKFFSNDGFPLSFGQLFTYVAGTTTPQATYVDSTQTTQNTNPIQLNFRGECNLWLDPTKSYKFLLQDLFGNTIPGWPIDNIPGGFGALPLNTSLIPNPTNTFNIGSAIFTWANGYFGTNISIGPNLIPILDVVSGNIGYYVRTAIEIAVGVTPTNFSYIPGHAFRYGAVGDGVIDDSVAVQVTLNVAAAYRALTRTSSQRNINAAYFPSATYLIKTPLTIPNGNGISVRAENDAWFTYNDSVIPGSYMITVGASGGGVIGFEWDLLKISLLTVTAKGLNFINNQDSSLNDYYCEAPVVAAGNMSSRTNVALRIESTTGQNAFFNRFGNLHLNHCHTGILVPSSGGFVGQHEIRYLNLFGDANNGDQASLGISAATGQDWIIQGGYVESYYSTPGSSAGISLANCTRWKASKLVFDVGGSLSGQMIGISIGGSSFSNQFEQCQIDPATIIVNDGTACSNGNLVENNPNISNTFTVVLTSGGGSITLNSGAGGNQLYCIKRGNEVHIWGILVVASVSAPSGTLLLTGLPFMVANLASNFSAASVWMSTANASAATQMMAYANRNTTTIVIEHFATGTNSPAAADIKAGTEIIIDCHYATVTAN